MSQTQEAPDFSKMYRPHQNEPERAIVAKPLITSDKDNWTKTLLRNGFVMTIIDEVAVWGKLEESPPYTCPLQKSACQQQFDDPEDYIQHVFEEIYRINMMTEGGLSRSQFVQVTMTPAAIGVMPDDANDKRMKEGSRK